MHSFKYLANEFEERYKKSELFIQEPTTLYKPCAYFLEEGGKRIRPVMCLMANELFGEINNDAWNAAFGIELFHNFTLIHDDIMDKAPLRRGKPTIHTKYGITSGILCGDVMSIIANNQIALIKNSLQQILQLFNKTAIEVCEGQQLDMDYETMDNVTMQDYIKMITLKTSVLLACSLKIGAITGGSLGNNADILYEFGKNLGIAFQLQDDYLDAFGQPDKTGKQCGGDIIANKKTFLLIRAIENATSNQKTEINNLLNNSTESKVPKMLNLFNETNANEDCKKAINSFSEIAFLNLENLAIPEKRKVHLYELAENLLKREK